MIIKVIFPNVGDIYDKEVCQLLYMVILDFDPWLINSLRVKFECIDCNHPVASIMMKIPFLDHEASNKDRESLGEFDVKCNNCNHDYYITICTNYFNGKLEISDLPHEYLVAVDELYSEYYDIEFDAISSNTSFHSTFKKEIEGLNKLSKFNAGDLSSTLRRQIFIGVIAAMETYLSDAFINTTLASEISTRAFVETFVEFKDRKINVSDIFSFQDALEKNCRVAMQDVIYHNLWKVKGMYKDTLKIDIGDIGQICKYVSIRHDLVHRSGKNMDGKHIEITEELISTLIFFMKGFVSNIDKQIRDITPYAYSDFFDDEE